MVSITNSSLPNALPIVRFTADETAVSEGEMFTWSFTLNQPAPAGGLTLTLPLLDSSLTPDDIAFNIEGGSNIAGFEPIVENGVLIGFRVTVAEGQTTATVVSRAIADATVEVDETFTITLSQGSNYVVAPSGSQVNLTIVDPNDILLGTSAAETLNGGAGNDTIYGEGGRDTLSGGSGDDLIDGGSESDTVSGGDGNDTIYGDSGRDTLSGGSGDDTLYGGSNSDSVSGGSGNDTIYGEGGRDTLTGGSGDDLIYGGSDSDRISGGAGNDTLYGEGGKDTIDGGSGDDLIYGGSEPDTILADAGNDTVYANGGDDLINTGAGLDTVWLDGAATVVLDKGEGFDAIENFQLGLTQFNVSSISNLSFVDSAQGVQIFQNNDLLAVVSFQTAGTFSSNVDSIFTT